MIRTATAFRPLRPVSVVRGCGGCGGGGGECLPVGVQVTPDSACYDDSLLFGVWPIEARAGVDWKFIV